VVSATVVQPPQTAGFGWDLSVVRAPDLGRRRVPARQPSRSHVAPRPYAPRMTTVLLIRHGRTTANSAGTLAGWTPGIGLDEVGRQQARALGKRLAKVPLAEVITSPLDRCRQTVDGMIDGRDIPVRVDERLGECRYGDWTGRSLKELAKQPLWRIVQNYPSAAVFPGPDGESLRAVQARAVESARATAQRLLDSAGPKAICAAVSHGDVIKLVVADALGLHLDLFQRLVIDPCSVTAIRYTPQRPFLLRLNDTGDFSALLPPSSRRKRSARSDEAMVGAGPATT
jgi:probable phosphomutase (TIGR03848 family)